jgi:hypothetical protein
MVVADTTEAESAQGQINLNSNSKREPESLGHAFLFDQVAALLPAAIE